jgi:hypothetical protein
MKGKDLFIGQFYKNKALGGYNQATFVLQISQERMKEYSSTDKLIYMV